MCPSLHFCPKFSTLFICRKILQHISAFILYIVHFSVQMVARSLSSNGIPLQSPEASGPVLILLFSSNVELHISGNLSTDHKQEQGAGIRRGQCLCTWDMTVLRMHLRRGTADGGSTTSETPTLVPLPCEPAVCTGAHVLLFRMLTQHIHVNWLHHNKESISVLTVKVFK